VLREAARTAPVAAGIDAVAPGVLWMHETRTLVAADAHLAYEDVVGGALPTWSTTDAIRILAEAARTMGAREILFLGDIIHGSRMSEGAAREVQAGLDRLRAVAAVTLVAGNHEGRSRGAGVLGETVESAERAGWLLVHGDRASGWVDRVIIGHLHPSVRSSGSSAPAFLSSERIIVVPALTAYSEGLDVCGDDCWEALQAFGATSRSAVRVTAATADHVYSLGSLTDLSRELRRPNPENGPTRYGYRRKFLRPDR
jgi:metallophosphoesterase superfamily enzyme